MVGPVPIEWIMEAGVRATGMSRRLLRSKWKHRSLVCARVFIATKMRAEGYSLNDIGRQFGGRDHATVMHWLNPTRVPKWRQPR